MRAARGRPSGIGSELGSKEGVDGGGSSVPGARVATDRRGRSRQARAAPALDRPAGPHARGRVPQRARERRRGHRRGGRRAAPGGSRSDAADRSERQAEGARPRAEPRRALGGRPRRGSQMAGRPGCALHAGRDPQGRRRSRRLLHPPQGGRRVSARRRRRADRAGAGAARGDRGISRVSYAFGDSERAAQRLALVARVFEPASEEFLASGGRRGGALAVDLGCGPGYTTELLARVLESERTVGLDASPAYVEAARTRLRAASASLAQRAASERRPQGGRAKTIRPATARCEFACHDVLSAPYPCGRADTLYARFLVSHLADPNAAIGMFASQLAPRGRLLLDEVEWIRSED